MTEPETLQVSLRQPRPVARPLWSRSPRWGIGVEGAVLEGLAFGSVTITVRVEVAQFIWLPWTVQVTE